MSAELYLAGAFDLHELDRLVRLVVEHDAQAGPQPGDRVEAAGALDLRVLVDGDRHRAAVQLAQRDRRAGDRRDDAAVDQPVLGPGVALDDHLGADQPVAEELVHDRLRQPEARAGHPEEGVERHEGDGEDHELAALHIHILASLSIHTRKRDVKEGGRSRPLRSDYFELAGSRSPMWFAAVASTCAREDPAAARIRTTTRSPTTSFVESITVGTLPCQSRKIVLSPNVKVWLPPAPRRRRSARWLPPVTSTLTVPLPTEARRPRKR